MTKPIDPFSLNGKPIIKGPGEKTETAEEILRKLRAKAGRTPSPLTGGKRSAGGMSAETFNRSGKAVPQQAQAGAEFHGLEHPATGSSETQASASIGQMNAQASVGDVDTLLMEGASSTATRSHLPVLAAVFLVSAIAGGTLAGMIFSSRLAPLSDSRSSANIATSQSPAKSGMKGTSVARKNETVVVPRHAEVSAVKTAPSNTNGSPVAMPLAASAQDGTARIPQMAKASAAKGRVIKDEARIPPTVSPGTKPRTHQTATPPPATAKGGDGASGKEAPRVKALPAASIMAGPDSVRIGNASRTTAGDAYAPGNDELKTLTDNVVAALAGLTQAGEAVTEQQTGSVRDALSALVERALAEGRSQDDVARLLDQALRDGGDAFVPAALRDASGKVDLRLLLASIVPMEAAHKASGAEQDYVNQLVAEGERTVVLDEGGKTTGKGRFYFRNGKRYTRIRPGDTLSRIAFDAYGDVLAYPVILRANAGRISIRRLKPGMEIEVPVRKDAALRTHGPVKLAPKGRTTPRKATASRRNGRNAVKARAQTKTPSQTAAQPASAPQKAPRKFINFRSRFTGGNAGSSAETR